MLGRIIGIAAIGSATLSVVALAAVILINRPPMERSVSAGIVESGDVGRTPFSGQAGGWNITAIAQADRDGGVQVDLRVNDSDGKPAPDELRLQGFLVMDGHPMPPETMSVERMTPGVYRVKGHTGMSGSWRLRLVLPGGSVETRLHIPG